MNNCHNGRYAVVIFSHSSYTDVWPLLIESYAKYFANDLFDFYITSDDTENARLLDGSRFSLLEYDSESSWSDAFIEVIRKISYEKVLFSFDDLILTKPVRRALLEDALENKRYDYLKIICSHVRFYDRVFRTGSYFDVRSSDSYRGSLVFSLISDKLLMDLAANKSIGGLSAWDYERSVNQFLSDAFQYGCVRTNIVRFENLIIKGKVNPVAAGNLRRRCGLEFAGGRKSMSIGTALVYHSKLVFFTLIKYFLPAGLFAHLRTLKRATMKAIFNGP